MSNKLRTIIVSIVCALVTIGLIITIFFLADINRKLAAPTNLMVVDNLPDGEIILQVDENPKAERYVFIIYKDGERHVQLVSPDNYITATSNFEEAGLYEVAARAVGKTEASLSDYCPRVEFIVRIKLATPSVQLDLENNRLLFSTVTGATSYELIYGLTEGGTVASLTDSRYFGEVGRRYFDLSTLPKGSYTFRLMAKGGEYEESDLTDPITYTKTEKLAAPTNVTFSNASKILTFNSSWHSFQVVAYYENSELTKTIKIEDTESSHSLDLTSYLTNNVSKLELTAIGNEFEFTTDSDMVVWQNA